MEEKDTNFDFVNSLKDKDKQETNNIVNMMFILHVHTNKSDLYINILPHGILLLTQPAQLSRVQL